jgi:hypothetical protein
MRAEISFDLVMEDDMDFVEGTYRLPGHDWQVLVFSRRPPVEKLEINTKGHWASGVTGVSVRFPKAQMLNKAAVMRVLSDVLGVTEWQEVHGPDSMQLR